jgi:hypothetical protein
MALEGTSDEDPPLAAGSAKMGDGDVAAQGGLRWRPAMKDNPYESPSECEPPSERKPHWLWRRWKSSTVTVWPFWALLFLIAIVTVIVELLAMLRS